MQASRCWQGSPVLAFALLLVLESQAGLFFIHNQKKVTGLPSAVCHFQMNPLWGGNWSLGSVPYTVDIVISLPTVSALVWVAHFCHLNDYVLRNVCWLRFNRERED